jgi:hypothetical protein
MITPTGQATGLMAIPGSGQLEWRELAQKSPEGRDTQHGYVPKADGTKIGGLAQVLRIDGDLSVAERTARVLAALAADEPESSARP